MIPCMQLDRLHPALLFVLAILSASNANAEIRRAVSVPAGDLIAALESLARQTDANLIYQPQQLRGLRTQGVSGTLTVLEAVKVLVRGTRLKVSFDVSSGAMLISASPDTREETSSPSRDPPALHVPEAEATVDSASDLLEALTVTGSRLRSARVAEEGAAPVTVIAQEDVRRSGGTTVYGALRSLPEISGYADNDSRAGNADTQQINLRGLGSQYTLVLVNGRRLGKSNLNLIPFVALQRVEILKDGASAIYGSDALAGVVNVLLRDRYDGAEVTVDYGNTTHFGDGAKLNGSALLGISNERGSLMLSGQYEKWNAVLSTEHSLGKSDDLRPFGGPDRRFPRYNPGLIRLSDGTQLMLNPALPNGSTGRSPADYVAPYDDRIEKQRINNLQNGREAGTFFGSARFDLLDTRIRLYTDFLHKSANIDYVDHRGVFIDALVPATNPWNSFGQDVHVTYVLDATTAGHEERGLETLTSDIETHMLTVGVEGTVGLFDYSIATNNWTSTDRQTHEGLSRAGILAQLARSDALALNVFGNAAARAGQIEPARATFRRELTNFTRSTTGIVRFEPVSLPAGPMRVAAGFEHRSAGFDSRPDETLSRDADALSAPFLNDPAVRAERRVNAYFAEVDLPILDSQQEAVVARSVDVTIAARRESFSDFAEATVQRATLRWQPASEDLALRASYSESFYAPELRDIQAMGDTNVGLVSDPLLRDSNGQPMTYLTTNVTGGNPDLNPTLGEYRNLGAILKPSAAPGLRFIVDLWRLDQTDAFVYPTVQSVVNGAAPGTVTRSPVALPGEAFGRIVNVVNRAANAAQRTVEGVDFGISYQRDLGHWGRWHVEWHNTFTTRFEYDQMDGRGTQNALGLISHAFDAVPRFRSNLVLSDTLGPLNITAATTYVDSVDNTFDSDRRVDPYVRTNLTLTYDLAPGMQLWGSVQDLFDTGVPYVGLLRTQGLASDFTYADYIGQFWTLGFRTRF